MIVVPYDPSHLLDGGEMKRYTLLGPEEIMPLAQQLEQLCRMGPAYTAFHEERPVGFAGAAILWPHVAEVWIYAYTRIEKDAHLRMRIHRFIEKMMHAIWTDYDLHRMQAVMHIDNRQGHRWIKLLGFESEGVMVKYDVMGNDYIRFAKTE